MVVVLVGYRQLLVNYKSSISALLVYVVRMTLLVKERRFYQLFRLLITTANY